MVNSCLCGCMHSLYKRWIFIIFITDKSILNCYITIMYRSNKKSILRIPLTDILLLVYNEITPIVQVQIPRFLFCNSILQRMQERTIYLFIYLIYLFIQHLQNRYLPISEHYVFPFSQVFLKYSASYTSFHVVVSTWNVIIRKAANFTPHFLQLHCKSNTYLQKRFLFCDGMLPSITINRLCP